MTFNKANLNTIRADITAALKAVEKKHGVSFDLGNIRYSDSNFRAKLECNSAADASGNTVNIDKANFERQAFLFDIAKDAFGKTFKSNGRTFTITGINSRAKKYPVNAVAANGDTYKFPVYQLPANLKTS